jgi:hypothetical protein
MHPARPPKHPARACSARGNVGNCASGNVDENGEITLHE